MRTHYLFLLLLVLAGFPGFGQNYQLLSTAMTGIANGGSCWGDYDNDGDLDLVVNGLQADWTATTLIYQNNNGQFTEVSGGLSPLYGGSARWGDYDNDEDLDLLLCGMNTSGEGETILYRNQNGVFEPVETPFAGIALGRALWLDENRDGWLDVVTAGDTLYNTPDAKLYHNNGDGTFSEVDAKLPASINSSYTFGDYDNDGDDDLFVTGFFENTYASRLFRNDNNGSFADTQIPFDSVAYGDMIFLDFDRDMDLDIVYMGNNVAGDYIARVYRNDGGDTFTRISSGITGEWVGQIDACDFDHDGDPDLAITGALCCGEALTELYKNDGSGTFSVYSAGLPARTFSQIRFGDVDNDGDADLLLTGLDEMGTGQPKTQLFRNTSGSNTFGINDPPGQPANLTAVIDLNDVTFSWSPSTDDNTPAAALTYTLYVGSAPSSCTVFSPLANQASGFSRVYAIGNVNQDTSWVIRDLPAGTYYWSVQAKDHSLTGSEFAPEQSFEITYIGLNDPSSGPGLSLYPNPASDFINLQSDTPGTLTLSNTMGLEVGSYPIAQGVTRIPVGNLPDGIYFIRFDHSSKSLIIKFIIRKS